MLLLPRACMCPATEGCPRSFAAWAAGSADAAESTQVLIAGDAEQVEQAVAAAEPHKEALMERGVLLVPLPIYERAANLPLSSMDEVPSDDLRSCLACLPACLR